MKGGECSKDMGLNAHGVFQELKDCEWGGVEERVKEQRSSYTRLCVCVRV